MEIYAMSKRHDAQHLSRRSILTSSLAALGGVVVTSVARGVDFPQKPGGLRFAHMTDMHVESKAGAPEGFAKALRSVATVNPAPQFIITGGDHVMDALERPRDRVDVQW